jgi:hypothetical protein
MGSATLGAHKLQLKKRHGDPALNTLKRSLKRPQKTPVSPLHLISVARRAHLSYNLTSKKEQAIRKLGTAQQYDESVRDAGIPKEAIEFHDEILLMGICGILETFLTDVSVEFLVCFPGEMTRKEFALEMLARKGSISGVLRESAEREINDLSYKTFPEMLARLQDIFHFKERLKESLLVELNEVKCTRDVYVHGKGIANHLYLRKAGESARVDLDRKLSLGDVYLRNAIVKSEELITAFFDSGPAKYLKFTQERAFKEMWDASLLANSMTFEDAWLDGDPFGDDPWVRPSKKALKWCWGGSGQALFDFFRGIFCPPTMMSNKERLKRLDVFEALARFPPSTPEGQIIISWMDSPFYF